MARMNRTNNYSRFQNSGVSGATATTTQPRMDVLGTIVKLLYGFVLIFALLLAFITIHSYKPVSDPITPIGFLDKLSFVMGVHDKQAVTVLDVDSWSTTVYTYIFHRHLNDNSFHLAEEKKVKILPGLFGLKNDSLIDARIGNILNEAESQQPVSQGALRLQSTSDYAKKTQLVVRVSNGVVINNQLIPKEELASVMRRFMTQLEQSDKFQVSSDSGVGTIDDIGDVRALQWFAINLMLRKLQTPEWRLRDTAIIFDVTEKDLNVTLAMPSSHTDDPKAPKNRVVFPKVKGVNTQSGGQLDNHVIAVKKMSAFGHPLQLVTLHFKDLGLYSARHYALTLPGVINNTLEERNEVIATTSEDIFRTTHQEAKVYNVRSACVNPIIDSYWQWNSEVFHIRGLEKGDHEMVKERNGPFAGKRINRPVANYNYCRGVMAEYVSSRIKKPMKLQLEALLKDRPVFIEGLMKEKAVERGLSLPDRGGDVTAKAMMDSLRHACRIPNTDQPLACADLTFLTTLFDRFFGFTKATVLRSSRNVNGFTAEWPLGIAFYVYENGLL